MEKTKAEIRAELLNNLAVKIGINTNEEGSIAVAIVDSLLDEVYSLYYELEMMKKEAYLSTSHGGHTDLIAELVGTNRLNDGETDEELKLRASTSVYRNALGNKLAIEEAAMAVPGVAAIDYRPYGSGTGSFSLYVYPQPGMNQVRLLADVEETLQSVVAEGIYFEVKQPEEKPVDIAVVIQFDSIITVMEKQRVRNQVKQKIVQYLNNLSKDEVLYINEITQLVMETSDNILDMRLMELKVNGLAKTITNTFPANDERFIAGEITIG